MESFTICLFAYHYVHLLFKLLCTNFIIILYISFSVVQFDILFSYRGCNDNQFMDKWTCWSIGTLNLSNFQPIYKSSNSRDRLVVRTLRCGRSNPGSNPGHGNVPLTHCHGRGFIFFPIFIYFLYLFICLRLSDTFILVLILLE